MSNPLVLDPKLARATAAAMPADNELRTGTVFEVVGGLVTVMINGGPVMAGYLASYLPRVGDTVSVLRQDASWLVLGSIAGDGGAPAEIGASGVLLVKTADESRFTSVFDAAADDAELQCDVAAGGIYVIDGLSIYTSGATPAFKHQWLYPSGEWQAPTYLYDPATADAQALVPSTYPTVGALTTGFTGTGARVPIWWKHTLFVGDTGGRVIYQWAQTTTNATAATLHKGSWMRVQRVGVSA